MSQQHEIVLGDLRISFATRAVERKGTTVVLRPKPFAMLWCLVQHRDRVITKAELLRSAWPGVTVSDHAIASALRDLRRALGDEPGAPPSIITVRGIGFRFVGAEGADAPPSNALGAAGARSGFVGRESQLATLVQRTVAAATAGVHTSLVTGMAGAGKTTLVSELVQHTLGQRVGIVVVRCLELGEAPELWPWLQLLRGARDCVRSVKTDPAAKERLEHDVAALLGELERAHEQPRPRTFALFERARDVLERASAQRPLLLVLEDLQWADEQSLSLLEFIAQTSKNGRLHLVLTLRPRPEVPGLARTLGVVARQPCTECVSLGALSFEDVAERFARTNYHVPEAFVARASAVTAGNPLLVAELAKLVESGELDPERAVTMPVPYRLRHVVQAQVAGLTSGVLDAVAAGAAAGLEFDAKVIAAALRRETADVLDALRDATRRGLVSSLADAPDVFAFDNELTRDCVRQELATFLRKSSLPRPNDGEPYPGAHGRARRLSGVAW